MGTNAHELPMVYSAIYRREDENAQRLVSSQRVIEDWEAEYGLGLSIFLPDTYGSDYFFNKVVTPRMLQSWKGSRHDLGPAPLSIVVKPVEANGLPVAKLSELERMKRLTGYTGSFSEACRY